MGFMAFCQVIKKTQAHIIKYHFLDICTLFSLYRRLITYKIFFFYLPKATVSNKFRLNFFFTYMRQWISGWGVGGGGVKVQIFIKRISQKNVLKIHVKIHVKTI